MSQKIIKPEGNDLVRYLEEGYIICNKCGALMDRREDPNGGNDVFACPSCGWEIDTREYEYEGPEDEEDEEWTDEMLDMYGGDVPPAGCRACGGPYPSCKISCPLFDD